MASEATGFGEVTYLRNAVRRPNLSWPIAGFFAVIITAVTVPKLSPVVVPVILLGLLLGGHQRSSAVNLSRASILARTVFWTAVSCVALLGITKSQKPLEAVWLCSSLAALIAASVWLCRSLRGSPAQLLDGMSRAVIAAIVFTSAYLTVEFCTQLSIISWIFAKVPMIAGQSKFTFIIDEHGRELVRRHVLNRSVGLTALLFWPTLLLTLIQVYRGRLKAISLPSLAMLMTAAILLSAHETSKVAVLLSAAVFVIAVAAPRTGLVLVMGAWILANLAVVPAVRVAYDKGLQLDATLTGSARARLTIWNFTAQRIGPTWLLGKGVDSVRQDDMQMTPKYVPGEAGLQRTGRHSHNVYLQIWYEFGAVGIALFTAAGLWLLAGVRRLPPGLVPFALASLTAAMVMMAFSWGLWQLWYAAALALSAAVFAIGTALTSYQLKSGPPIVGKAFNTESRQLQAAA